MTEDPDRLSIIVVSFNEAAHVERLKRAIDALEKPCSIEIETILVDGGSRDETVARAKTAGFTRIVEIPGGSIPVCRNRGLAEATGSWLAFIDADCEPNPDWLKAAVAILHQQPCAILGWPVSPPSPGTWVQRAWYIHWSNKNPHFEHLLGQPVVRKEAFRLITTRNMVLHRSAADRVGGFDENLPTGEDTDFVFRAAQQGVQVLGLPSLKVLHHGEPATLSTFFKQQLWHANRTSYRTIYRETGGRSGGNAPRFTLLFAAALLVLLTGLGLFAVSTNPWWLAAGLPLLGLVGLPGAAIAFRARKPASLPALMLLYAAYGLARTLDLAGIGRKKKSWKQP